MRCQKNQHRVECWVCWVNVTEWLGVGWSWTDGKGWLVQGGVVGGGVVSRRRTASPTVTLHLTRNSPARYTSWLTPLHRYTVTQRDLKPKTDPTRGNSNPEFWKWTDRIRNHEASKERRKRWSSIGWCWQNGTIILFGGWVWLSTCRAYSCTKHKRPR